jgi:two-component system, sensor histidine kinase
VRGEISNLLPFQLTPVGSEDAAPVPAPIEILVVDDNAANLLAIEAALDGIGCRLVTAQSGSDALRRLLDRDFALILLDVQMPGMDGYETAHLIRGRERTRLTPIIFVTAYERDERQMLAGYALGAVDFLYKPIVPEILRAKAQVFVQLHQRTAEVARQAALLAAAESQELRRQLEADRKEWEAAALRVQMEKERRTAEAMAVKAAELARAVANLEKTEAELLESNRRLSASDQRKDEFLAILGHELRNPLAPMVNALELLRDRVEGDERALKAHGALERQVDHLRRLVDDLLDLSRIDSGKIELRREVVELSGIVNDAILMTRPLFDGRGQTLAISQPDAPIYLDADPTRLVQVVANLLTNAARYSPEGAVTRLELGAEGDQAVVRVTDQGRGIAPELLSRVFESFVQAKSGGGGLGIGLTVARKLIERHGGQITGTSEGIDQGSTFEIRLPLRSQGSGAHRPVNAARRSPPPAPAPVAEPPSGPLRVVLVEDSEDIRETTQALLERSGHSVATACDGPSGVDLIVRTRPDVALVDIGLPGFDGHEVASRVRAALGQESVRLVAMTGFGQASDRQRAQDAGFDDHLTKPAKADQLREALRASR